MRDLRADSRFDTIRLSFRSSMTDATRFESSEPGGVRLGSSEPELDVTRFGLVGLKPERSDPSHELNGLSIKGSEAGNAERLIEN